MCELNNRPLPKFGKESRKFSQILSQAKFLSELNDKYYEGECAEDIDAAEEFECPFQDSSNSLPLTLHPSPFTEQGMEEESDLEDLIEQELEQGQDDIEYTTEEPKVMVYLVGNYMN